MDMQTVDTLLLNYRTNRGRYDCLSTAIASMRRDIDKAKAEARADLIFSSRGPDDGMPKPKGGIGRPVENMGIKLADGITSDEIKELQDKLRVMMAEHEKLHDRVRYVEAWLRGITQREKWVIEHKSIDGETWADITSSYIQAFNSPVCSQRSIKRIRDNAMDKIYQMAKEI